MKPINLLLSLFMGCQFAAAQSIPKASLAGTWDYTTYTGLEKGKPIGTIQLKPHTMLFTYHEDGTWQMEAADATHTRKSGTYDLHGSELILKKADGSTYLDFQLELRDDGKTMILKDNRSLILATKAEPTP